MHVDTFLVHAASFFSMLNIVFIYQKRFRELYAKKSKYSVEEFEGYLEGFYALPGKPASLVECLLQHTRLIDGFYVVK